MASISDIDCVIWVKKAETHSFSNEVAACLLVDINPAPLSELSREEKQKLGYSIKELRKFILDKHPELFRRVTEQELAEYKHAMSAYNSAMTEWRSMKNYGHSRRFAQPKKPIAPKDIFLEIHFDVFLEAARFMEIEPIISSHIMRILDRSKAEQGAAVGKVDIITLGLPEEASQQEETGNLAEDGSSGVRIPEMERSNEWREMITSVAKAYEAKHSKLPSFAQFWAFITENPPSDYSVKCHAKHGQTKAYIEMGGDKKDKEAFKKQFERHPLVCVAAINNSSKG